MIISFPGRRLAILMICGLGASACSSYRSEPIDANAYAVVRAHRQLSPDRSWSSGALLKQALSWSVALDEPRAAFRAATAEARAARVPLPAALQLTTEYSHQDNPNKPWLGGGTLDLPLDLGGRRDARVNAADLAAAQARLDYAEALWRTRAAILQAMVDRNAADEALPIAKLALALRHDRMSRLEARVRAGEDPQSAVMTARTDVAAAERRLQEIVALRREAVITLADAVGVEPAVAENLVLTMPASQAAPDAVTLRQTALLGRSDVLRAILDYDVAENDVRKEVAGQYPAISLQPGYTYERGITKLPFGLNLQLPPIDGNRAAIRAAEARRAVAGTKLEAVQAALLAEVDRADAAFSAAQAAERLQETQGLPVALRMATAAEAGLRVGALDHVDLDAAQAAVADAQLDRIEAARIARRARTALEDALRYTGDSEEARVIADAMTGLGETR